MLALTLSGASSRKPWPGLAWCDEYARQPSAA